MRMLTRYRQTEALTRPVHFEMQESDIWTNASGDASDEYDNGIW